MSFISGLFGGGKAAKVVTPAPPPQVDDAVARMNEAERVAKRKGRKSTALTGDSGLPDLGATSSTGS
jgi:hypothetical protein